MNVVTRWQEVDDLGLDQEFDELDPMAAPVGAVSDAEDEDGGDGLFGEARGPWDPTSGFPDGLGVLRIWIDDEGRITKVRLSPSWREKLGKTPLAVAFGQSFTYINSWARPEAKGVDLSADDRQASQPFGWEQIDRIARRTTQLQEQLDSLGPEAEGQLRGRKVVGESPDKLCAITLELNGELGGIQFNGRKLAESRVRDVTDAVVKAHAAALAEFEPGEYVAGEADRLRNELQGLRNEALAMMRRGFR